MPPVSQEPEPKVSSRSEADLGQKEAELKKASEEELKHMEGGKAPQAAVKRKRYRSSQSEPDRV